MSEEHGILDLSGTDWRPRVGDRVRVVPNHVCLSVHLQERLHGVRGDEDRGGVDGGGSRPLPPRLTDVVYSPDPGLCGSCANSRTVETRTSRFYLCRLSSVDPRFPKYPRIPVLRCVGFTPKRVGGG
jgi:hypothetical protein